MADFKTALIALSNDEIAYEVIEENIGKILNRNPALAIEILEQLQDAFNAAIIDAEEFAKFKSYVTQLSARENPEVTIAHEARAAIGAGGDIDLALDFDLSPVTENPARRYQDKATTDTSWPSDKSVAGGRPKSRKIEPGAVIRGRFQLDKILGVGGMGTVFRGRDLIKVEARDKNPYVAIKILNEDFKDHPDGFIALQREASRQQKLAHPNIATVYDFDRTEDGTFFLTMELLEGQPLNRFIKKVVKPQRGLPFEQAFPMIEGLANALIFAHEHDIVHSDFKPGNCFITTDGTMKVLDFGIARAVKTPGQGDTTDKTIFDPGKLGALTPPYASVEMLEELEPDTRDDIYALACVAYELLTGKHPFNKLRATTARDNQLVPIPIKGLKKSQIKALNHGLGFTREERSQTVREFLEELRGKSSKFANPWVTIPSIAVILAAIGIFPLIGLMHDREIDRFVTSLRSGDTQEIEQTLDVLRQDDIDQNIRDRVLVAARDNIFTYYEEKIAAEIIRPANEINLGEAHSFIDELSELPLFADSSQVADWRLRLQKTESDLLNQQSIAFNEAILSDRLLDMDDQDDVHDVLKTVRRLNPDIERTLRLRLPGAYAAAIHRAIVNEEFERAVALSQAGLKIAPDDIYLGDLAVKIAGAQERNQLSNELTGIENHIRDALAVGTQLNDFHGIQEQIQKLAFFSPDSPIIAELKNLIQSFFDSTQTESPDLNDFSLLFGSLGMYDTAKMHREKLRMVDREIADLFSRLRAQILSPDATIESPAITNSLTALAQYSIRHPLHKNALRMTARWTLNQARRARSLGNFSGAEEVLNKLSELIDQRIPLPEVSDEKQIIAALINNNAVHYVQNSAQQKMQFERQAEELKQQLSTTPIDADNLSILLKNYDDLVATNPASAQLSRYRRNLIEATHTAADLADSEENKQLASDLLSQLVTYFPDDQAAYESLLAIKDNRDAIDLENIESLKREMALLISEPSTDRRWNQQVQDLFLQLQRKLTEADPWLDERKAEISDFFLAQAEQAKEKNQFASSEILLWRAEPFTANRERLAKQRAGLKARENEFVMKHRIRERDARILGLKKDFDTQLSALDLTNATRTYESLKRQASSGNYAELGGAGERLTAAYLSVAAQELSQDDLSAALQTLIAGKNALPDSQEIIAALQKYQALSHQRQISQALTGNATRDLPDLISRIEEMKGSAPHIFAENEKNWAVSLVQRVKSLSQTNPGELDTEIARLKALFPHDPIIQNIDSSGAEVNDGGALFARIEEIQDEHQLSAARRLLNELSPQQRNKPEFSRLSTRQDSLTSAAREHFSNYKIALDSNNNEVARREILAALDSWRDNKAFIDESQAWLNDEDPEAKVNTPDNAANNSKCMHKLAGQGKRLSGTCFDMLSPTMRGPLLVVIPDQSSSRGAFAIGKFEVTVGDFNAYCKDTQACNVDLETKNNFPKSNVSVAQIRNYLDWLSTKTGERYRLPSVSEWTYAAHANGNQPRKDVNCRVVQHGEIIMGNEPEPIDRGKANGWGIYNYLGNVQELATDGDELFALGGSFADDIQRCTVEIRLQHLGAPERITGFRVVREF